MTDEFDWRQLFNPGESPYFAMFRCGCIGIPVEECITYCHSMSIPLRSKDIRAWEDGDWKKRLSSNGSSVLNPVVRPGYENIVPVIGSKLTDFQTLPTGWNGTERRWFPCNEDNMPMQKWGYSPDYSPTLYDRDEAKALSPIGWVGQNLYAQPFIVIDIDGVGHGRTDHEVIAFGERYKDTTETWENPAKRGSFHLYFTTDRQIPISHFPFAKLDLMGNQKNTAVYTKDKVPNGIMRRPLTEEIWAELQDYIEDRRQRRGEGA